MWERKPAIKFVVIPGIVKENNQMQLRVRECGRSSCDWSFCWGLINFTSQKQFIYSMIVPPQRQVLHQNSMKSWFKSRHSSNVKLHYLKTQRQISDDDVIVRTFHLIDRNNSKTLDIEELYSMFKKNGYDINLKLLRKFFDIADSNHNRCIELEEFLQVVQNEKACQCFSQMMRKMRDSGTENYYSTDFVKLLRYLSYCENRSDLTLQIQVWLLSQMNRRIPVVKRSKLITGLIRLSEQFTDLTETQAQPDTHRSGSDFPNRMERRYLTPMPAKVKAAKSQTSTNTHINTSISGNSYLLSSFCSPNSVQKDRSAFRLRNNKSDTYLQLNKKKLV